MSIIQEYLNYVKDTEPPIIFHRWSLLTCIGALLERNVSYGDGYFTFHPNLYVMLMGESGTRKSTAINLAKTLLGQSGYEHFSAEQTSKEKYLEDLAAMHESFEDDAGGILTAEIFKSVETNDSRTTPNFIVAGEFNDFIGNGNIEFMSILGNLWDWRGSSYKKRIKSGKSVSIPNPTISILGGNTATGFSLAFPPAAIGQGFFSRLILVHAVPSGRKTRKPKFRENGLSQTLREVRRLVQGPMRETALADKLLDAIYEEFEPLEDTRFASYSTRRYAQLIKLCMICAAMRMSTCIDESDVILANTMLTHAECLMPRALGEFGKARTSDIAHTVLGMIQTAGAAGEIVTIEEIWKCVSQDLDNNNQLMDILRKLLESKKIQLSSTMNGHGRKSGFLPIHKAIQEKSDFVDFGLLTEEERRMTA